MFPESVQLVEASLLLALRARSEGGLVDRVAFSKKGRTNKGVICD